MAIIKVPSVKENETKCEAVLNLNQNNTKWTHNQKKRERYNEDSSGWKSYLVQTLKINNTIEDWEEEVKSLPNLNSSQHFDKLMNHKKIFENNITNAESPFVQVSRNEIKNKED